MLYLYCKFRKINGSNRLNALVLWSFTSVFLGLFLSCDVQDPSPLGCSDKAPLISFAALRDSTLNGIYRFNSAQYLKGVVVSSDEGGQFFGKIVIQETPSGASEGLLLSTDLSDASLWFVAGQEVYLSLKGLYADEKTLGLSVGSVFTSFGNLSIGRLPILSTHENLHLSCNPIHVLTPKQRKAASLTDQDLQTLVTVDSLKIDPELKGALFAVYQEDSPRNFYGPQGHKVVLENSGYSDFWNTPLPEGWVKITGILSKTRNQYYLEIRTLEDVVSIDL